MPTILIKPDRDQDVYVAWSTIVEAPVAWGNRDEMLKWATKDWSRHRDPSPISDPSARLDRADATGTSAAGGFSFFGAWDDDGFIYEQRGILPRQHLIRACELLGEEREAEVWDLLKPFEDLTEVRRE